MADAPERRRSATCARRMSAIGGNAEGARRVVRGAVGGQPADERPTPRRPRRRPTWSPRPPSRSSRNVQTVATGTEEMTASHPRDRQERARGRAASPTTAVQVADDDQRDGRQARRVQRGDRQGRSRSSPRSPSRPTCWRSTPPSRRRAPARPARASRSSPTRSRSWPRRPPRPPRTSASRSRRSRPTPRPRSTRSREIGQIIAQINDIQTTIATRGRGADRDHQRDRPQRQRGRHGQRRDRPEHHRCRPRGAEHDRQAPPSTTEPRAGELAAHGRRAPAAGRAVRLLIRRTEPLHAAYRK